MHVLDRTKLGLYFLLVIIFSFAPIVAPATVSAATRYETGIATSATLLRMKQHELDQRLQEIKSMGAIWIRVDFNWYAVQPYEGENFIWDMYDKVVDSANRHGLKILAVVGYTARWAQDPLCTRLAGSEWSGSARQCEPRDKNEFAHFAASAAERYKGQSVRAWEIWNEPNLTAYWKSVGQGNLIFTDVEAYAAVANEAARRIRHHYPDSLIITGGLAPLFEPKFPKGMRQSDFLRELLPQLKHWYFDGVGIHPYSWPALPETKADYNAFYTVDGGGEYNLREIMKQAGWGNKEIWGTEFGASTSGHRSSLLPMSRDKRPDHVPEHTQADIVQQGVKAWYKKENVGPLFVHSDSDKWLLDARNEGGFGLKRDDGSAKPAYRAFVKAAADVARQE